MDCGGKSRESREIESILNLIVKSAKFKGEHAEDSIVYRRLTMDTEALNHQAENNEPECCELYGE